MLSAPRAWDTSGADQITVIYTARSVLPGPGMTSGPDLENGASRLWMIFMHQALSMSTATCFLFRCCWEHDEKHVLFRYADCNVCMSSRNCVFAFLQATNYERFDERRATSYRGFRGALGALGVLGWDNLVGGVNARVFRICKYAYECKSVGKAYVESADYERATSYERFDELGLGSLGSPPPGWTGQQG